MAAVNGELEVILPIEGLVDIVSLRLRLAKDLNKAEKDIEILSSRLSNPKFSQKAPQEIVEECRLGLSDAKIQADLVRKRLLLLD